MQNKEHYTGEDVQVKYLDSGNQAFITVQQLPMIK